MTFQTYLYRFSILDTVRKRESENLKFLRIQLRQDRKL